MLIFFVSAPTCIQFVYYCSLLTAEHTLCSVCSMVDEDVAVS